MIAERQHLTPAVAWRLARHPESTLIRLLEHEHIPSLGLEGTSLDIGGGAAAEYCGLLPRRGRIDSVNLDPSMRPTVLADLTEGLPFPAGAYNNVLCFNTLEHVWDDTSLLREAYRVLKPGGRLFLLVPFVYRVHASPDDYHRHTASGWHRMLEAAGFPGPEVEIIPIASGAHACALSLVEFGYPREIRRLLRIAVLVLPALARSVRNALAGRRRTGVRHEDVPLGYFIRARK